MKIKINSQENYNIEIPEEMSQSDFLGLVSRLNSLCKFISKAEIFESLPIPTKKKVRVFSNARNMNLIFLSKERDKGVQVVKLLNDKSIPSEQRLLNANNYIKSLGVEAQIVDWKTAVNYKFNLKKRHQMTDAEIN